jgi:hypothetical protein
VARGRLENQLSALIFPPKTNATNERLAQHLLTHNGELLRSCVSRGWRLPTGTELAIRFAVILPKVAEGEGGMLSSRQVSASQYRQCMHSQPTTIPS